MNALIFAAGLGTRLKPLTDTMPKAMVPINGKPLVQILIEKLKQIGVEEIVINVHHFAQQIIDFVQANNSFGINIKFSDETEMLLETGGGLKKAAKLFSNDAPILVHNVDILSNADLKALYEDCTSYMANGTCGASLLVSYRETQRYLLFDDDNNLVGWTNIATGQIKSPYAELKAHDGEMGNVVTSQAQPNCTLYMGNVVTSQAQPNCTLYMVNGKCYHLFAFSGIQVFNPEILPYMDTWEGKFSIIDFYLSICDKVQIKCCPNDNLSLLDVGKLDTIKKAEEFLAKNLD